MKYVKIDIGAKIRYFRKKLCLSQEALALKAEIHPAHFGKLERNEKNPTVETLDKIISAIGISYGEFFSDSSGNEVNKERDFYIYKVISSLEQLPDDKLKTISEAFVKIVESTK